MFLYFGSIELIDVPTFCVNGTYRCSYIQSDYRERKPKIDVRIDRDRAADLGVSLSNIGRTLETILGSRGCDDLHRRWRGIQRYSPGK